MISEYIIKDGKEYAIVHTAYITLKNGKRIYPKRWEKIDTDDNPSRKNKNSLKKIKESEQIFIPLVLLSITERRTHT